MKLFNTWKEVMFNPLNFYEKIPKKIGYKEPSKFFLKIYAITLGIVYLIMFFIGLFIALFTSAFGEEAAIITGSIMGIVFLVALIFYPLLVLFSWGMLYVSAGITHLLVLAFGGKEGYVETFKAVSYSVAPAIFGFIPIVNWLVGIYSIILQIIGIKARQKLSWGKSVAVILIPVGVILMIVFIFYFILFRGIIAGSLGGVQ